MSPQSKRPRSVLDAPGPDDDDVLARARWVGERTAEVGFDWPTLAGVREKVSEELAELDDAIARGVVEDMQDELGDLLFTLVSLTRFLPVEAKPALAHATAKFTRRYRAMETILDTENRQVASASLAQLDAAWNAVKRSEREPSDSS